MDSWRGKNLSNLDPLFALCQTPKDWGFAAVSSSACDQVYGPVYAAGPGTTTGPQHSSIVGLTYAFISLFTLVVIIDMGVSGGGGGGGGGGKGLRRMFSTLAGRSSSGSTSTSTSTASTSTSSGIGTSNGNGNYYYNYNYGNPTAAGPSTSSNNNNNKKNDKHRNRRSNRYSSGLPPPSYPYAYDGADASDMSAAERHEFEVRLESFEYESPQDRLNGGYSGGGGGGRGGGFRGGAEVTIGEDADEEEGVEEVEVASSFAGRNGKGSSGSKRHAAASVRGGGNASLYDAPDPSVAAADGPSRPLGGIRAVSSRAASIFSSSGHSQDEKPGQGQGQGQGQDEGQQSRWRRLSMRSKTGSSSAYAPSISGLSVSSAGGDGSGGRGSPPGTGWAGPAGGYSGYEYSGGANGNRRPLAPVPEGTTASASTSAYASHPTTTATPYGNPNGPGPGYNPNPTSHNPLPIPVPGGISTSTLPPPPPPGPTLHIPVTPADVRDATRQLRRLYALELEVQGLRYVDHEEDEAYRAGRRAQADALRREVQACVTAWRATADAGWSEAERALIDYAGALAGRLDRLGGAEGGGT